MVKMIVGMSLNGVIGKGGKLAHHSSPDMMHFRQTTEGHTVVMGRKTYEEIGRPLKNRRNIVVSSQPDKLKFRDKIEITDDLGFFKEFYQNPDKHLFIIGGASLYTSWSANLYTEEYLVSYWPVFVNGNGSNERQFLDISQLNRRAYGKILKTLEDGTIVVSYIRENR